MKEKPTSRHSHSAHGWLAIDKPSGLTSADVVARVKKSFMLSRKFKVGHAGTLDPLATGVLPVALGEATKVVRFVTDKTKEYDVRVKWGESRDTEDSSGKLIDKTDYVPSEQEIIKALPKFIGEIKQIPPSFSAIKIKGQRAYKLARKNINFTLEPRLVRVDSISLINHGSDFSNFSIICGKGMYVRSLVRDLASFLGSLGYVSVLRRTKVGYFEEELAISLENLETLGHSAARLDIVLPVDFALADIPALELTKVQAAKLRNGQKVVGSFLGAGIVRAKCGSQLVAMAETDGIWLRPTRVFNH
ncbi:MAG: tRNA pseudouridine(55) synthase TruB [Alphaproteobacteria bacterium]|nr:tRNA pseudouridine(55) synthase TruB [Alphaproteobacteria bacterium]